MAVPREELDATGRLQELMRRRLLSRALEGQGRQAGTARLRSDG